MKDLWNTWTLPSRRGRSAEIDSMALIMLSSNPCALSGMVHVPSILSNKGIISTGRGSLADTRAARNLEKTSSVIPSSLCRRDTYCLYQTEIPFGKYDTKSAHVNVPSCFDRNSTVQYAYSISPSDFSITEDNSVSRRFEGTRVVSFSLRNTSISFRLSSCLGFISNGLRSCSFVTVFTSGLDVTKNFSQLGSLAKYEDITSINWLRPWYSASSRASMTKSNGSAGAGTLSRGSCRRKENNSFTLILFRDCSSPRLWDRRSARASLYAGRTQHRLRANDCSISLGFL